MKQTEKTAIVLRYANYGERDRMLTLFSPTRGLIEAAAHGCRRPRSRLLRASELFTLGDFELFEKGGRYTVTGFSLIENFYPLRNDWERLNAGMYMLNLCEAAIQPGENSQELFMLLLHTLSRLTFSDQPWVPLLSGFLAHFANTQGYRPRLRHCVVCGERIADGAPAALDLREGGLVCGRHRQADAPLIAPSERAFLRHVLETGCSAWVEDAERTAPLALMERYVGARLDKPLRVQPPEAPPAGNGSARVQPE